MKSELQTFVLDTIYTTGLAAGSIAAYNDDGLLPLNVGLMVAGSLGLMRSHFLRRAKSTYNNQRRKLAQMASIKQMPRIDPDFARYEMKWKETEPPEFVFVGDILPIPVLRSEFYRMIEIACIRQRQALYGTRYNKRKPKINWILSERHFTQIVRPRFHNDLYWSIIIILSTTRLKRGGKQGDSGHLVGEYGPNRYTELAMIRWMQLFGPSPKKQKSIFSLFH